MRTVVDMSGHALRLDERSFRFLIIGAGLCWSVAFVVIALFYELELYGDGAMFSYAVAVRDVWAFHWHNISGRTSVFLLSLLAAEALVGIRGNPWVGIITYGLLFYISPFVGLILTYVADRSPGNTIFVYACTSTAMLCPLIFGFPTEMWLAHAIFWPVLALSHCARLPSPTPQLRYGNHSTTRRISRSQRHVLKTPRQRRKRRRKAFDHRVKKRRSEGWPTVQRLSLLWSWQPRPPQRRAEE